MPDEKVKLLDTLLDEVEAVFSKRDESFEFLVESFQPALTARRVYEEISGKRLSIMDFYDFISDKRAVKANGEYLTENWRRVIPHLIPMLKDDQLVQLAEVIIDDPLVNSLTKVEHHRIRKPPILIQAFTYVCNADAYLMMANVYEHLVNTYGLNLIFAEGADGEINTAWFKAFPDDQVRKDVAKYFVRKGEITAPELVSITSDADLKLFGVEDRDLYIKLLNYETAGKKEEGVNIWDVCRVRREKILHNINMALLKYMPNVAAAEAVSVGFYSMPDLLSSTEYTVLQLRPRVDTGINWGLYHKIIRNEKTPIEEILCEHISEKK